MDYTYRALRSITIIHSYWQVSSVMAPPADVRVGKVGSIVCRLMSDPNTIIGREGDCGAASKGSVASDGLLPNPPGREPVPFTFVSAPRFVVVSHLLHPTLQRLGQQLSVGVL